MPQLFDAQNAYTYWVHDFRPAGPARVAGNLRNPVDGDNYDKKIIKKRAAKLLGYNYFVPRFLPAPGNFPAAASPVPLPYTAENMAYERDVGIWFGTLQHHAHVNRQGNLVAAGPNTLPATEFLQRIFALLLYASSHNKFFYKRGGNWQAWQNSQIPIASALSHGGRVLIELTDNNAEYTAIRNWLFGGCRRLVKRTGTHGVEPLSAYENDATLTGAGIHKWLKEIKTGVWNSNVGRWLLTSHRRKLESKEYGVNLGLGGWNNYNFISGKLVKLDGTHGHLYIYTAKPAERWSTITGGRVRGCIMIGCEGSAPINMYKKGREARLHDDQVKLFKGWAYDQTGHPHGFGGSGRFSPTGGLKWKENEWHTIGPDDSCDGMYVNLDGADITHLTTGAFNTMQIQGATTWNDNLVGYNCLP